MTVRFKSEWVFDFVGIRIQKVFEVDPLVCSHCQGRLRVVSFIEDALVIRMPSAIRFATKVSAIEEPLL